MPAKKQPDPAPAPAPPAPAEDPWLPHGQEFEYRYRVRDNGKGRLDVRHSVCDTETTIPVAASLESRKLQRLLGAAVDAHDCPTGKIARWPAAPASL